MSNRKYDLALVRKIDGLTRFVSTPRELMLLALALHSTADDAFAWGKEQIGRLPRPCELPDLYIASLEAYAIYAHAYAEVDAERRRKAKVERMNKAIREDYRWKTGALPEEFKV